MFYNFKTFESFKVNTVTYDIIKHHDLHVAKIDLEISSMKVVDKILLSCKSCRSFKGCGMGPLLVLVSTCFRENVVVTCKIWSFLCSLDNLLQKNVIVFFFVNQISKWRSFEKAILAYFSYFLVTRGKLHKFLQHISHSHTYMYFAHPIDFFCLTNLKKK